MSLVIYGDTRDFDFPQNGCTFCEETSTAGHPGSVYTFVPTPLQKRAARLYPDSEYLQREWLRAVAVVRSTRNGWHLDQPVERKQ